jgi:hypothetical protein
MGSYKPVSGTQPATSASMGENNKITRLIRHTQIAYDTVPIPCAYLNFPIFNSTHRNNILLKFIPGTQNPYDVNHLPV